MKTYFKESQAPEQGIVIQGQISSFCQSSVGKENFVVALVSDGSNLTFCQKLFMLLCYVVTHPRGPSTSIIYSFLRFFSSNKAATAQTMAYYDSYIHPRQLQTVRTVKDF